MSDESKLENTHTDGNAPKWQVLSPGTIFADHYEIVECLGQGGMSTVYKVRDLNISRVVALKCLQGHFLNDQTALQRFQQEAKNAGLLEHPNIVRIEHYGIDSAGLPYIVMELLEGRPLSAILRSDPPMDRKRGIYVLSQVCAGLAYSHQNGIVHRDLKPSNIMVLERSGEEIVKIVDFGIAKALTPDPSAKHLTTTGDLVGSPLYMSPEQCMMLDLDARSDIYALGCLITCVFTGAPPFYSENLYEVYYQHINDSPKPIAEKRHDLECVDEIDAIMLKCMAKEPADRYQSVNEVAQALKQLGGDRNKPWFARLLKLVEIQNLRLKARKNPKIRKAIIAGGTLYLALTAVGAWFLLKSTLAPPESTWRNMYSSGQHEIDVGNYRQAETLLSQAVGLASRVPGRNEKVAAALSQLIDVERITNQTDKLHQNERDLYDAKLKLEQSDPELDNDIARVLAGKTPEELESMQLCERINDAAAMQLQLGNVTKAQKLLSDARTLLARLPKENPELTARTLHNQALAAHRAGDLELASNLYNQSADLTRRLISPNSPTLGKSLIGVGKIAMQKHDYADGQKAFQEALAIYRAAFGPQSEQVAWVKVNLGELYIKQNHADLARAELSQARTIYDSLSSPDIDKKTRCYALLAKADNRDDLLGEALALQETSERQEDVYLAWILTELAERKKQAPNSNFVALMERALAIYMRVSPPERERIWRLIETLENHQHGEKAKSVEKWYDQAIQRDSKFYGTASAEVADDLRRQAEYYRRRPDLYLSEQKYKEAMSLEGTLSQDKSWNAFDLMAGLGTLYADAGRPRDAESLFAKAKTALEHLTAERSKAVPKTQSAAIRDFIYRYKLLLEQLGKGEDAKALEKEWPHESAGR